MNVPGAGSPTAPAGDAAAGREPARRPYEAPAIEETSGFETLALNCTGMVNEQTCYQSYAYHNS